MIEELPKINWIKNDPKKYNFFTDGSEFLCALQVTNTRTKETKWEFSVVRTNCDGESMHLMSGDDYYHDWDFSDFEYFHLISGEMPCDQGDYDE